VWTAGNPDKAAVAAAPVAMKSRRVIFSLFSMNAPPPLIRRLDGLQFLSLFATAAQINGFSLCQDEFTPPCQGTPL
jgi:hypothetical protein